jgi:hypothetical protein
MPFRVVAKPNASSRMHGQVLYYLTNVIYYINCYNKLAISLYNGFLHQYSHQTHTGIILTNMTLKRTKLKHLQNVFKIKTNFTLYR